MGILKSQLVLSLIDKASGPARKAAHALGGMKEAAERSRRDLRRMQGQMLGAAGTGYVLARSISAPIKSAMDFESAMADVRKVVDFEAPGSFEKMRKDIIDMSMRLPMTANQIAEIVAAAGQAGMAGDELTKFAELAAKVGVAFDMTASQTGESLAKIKTALGLSVGETRELADAINHLSNTSAASAPDLVDYMRRVGSVGKQYGFTAEQTAAIGAAMIASGAQADVAATSFRNAGKALARGESASKSQKVAFKRLGLDAVKVSKNLQKDAVGTLKAVIGQIRQLPKHLQASTITDLFGDEARALAPLIENMELLDGALSNVADKAKYLGSSQKEFEERSKTSAAELQKFQNKLDALSIALGSSLLPVLNSIMDKLGPLIVQFADWVDANQELASTLITIAGGIAALAVAGTTLRFAFKFLKTGLFDVAAGIFKITKQISKLTGASKALGAGTKAAAAGGAAGTAAAGTGGAAAGAAARKGVFGRALSGGKWLGKRALGPVSWAYLSYEVLDGLQDKIATVTRDWSQAEKDALVLNEMLKPSPNHPGQSEADIGLAELRTELAQLDARIAQIDPNGPMAAMLVKPLEDERNLLAAEISEIEATMTRLSSGLEKTDASAKSAATALDGFGAKLRSFGIPLPKPTSGLSLGGARALGGSIVGGRTYLVGERGPELVTPSQSGYVHTAKDTAGILAGQGAGDRTLHVSFGDIIIHEATNAQEMIAQFTEQVGDALSGLQADLEPVGA